MSRAFTKEPDGDEAFEELPDKIVSPHRNIVTEAGLARLEAALAAAQGELAEAQSTGDRAAMARATRDVRYLTQRRATAEVQLPPANDGVVHFGAKVTILRGDGRRQTFRIVGEDEADPSAGSVSYVSPLAQALLGKRTGDEIAVAGQDAEIVAIKV